MIYLLSCPLEGHRVVLTLVPLDRAHGGQALDQ